MVTPRGCSGVQRVPKAGHSRRLPVAAQHQPADALARLFLAAARPAAEPRLGVEVAVVLREAEPAFRDLADAAPAPRARPGRPRRMISCAGCVAAPAAPSGAYWFSTSARPSSSCRTAEVDALEDVERLEAGDHDRHAVLRRAIGSYSSKPMMVQTWPAARKPWTRLVGRREDGAHRRRHEDVARRAWRSCARPVALRLVDRHGVGRGRGLEADGEEDHLARGIRACDRPARRAANRRRGRRRRAPSRRGGRRSCRGRAACRRRSRGSCPAGRRSRSPCRCSRPASRRPGSRARGSASRRRAAARRCRSGRSRGSGRRTPP